MTEHYKVVADLEQMKRMVDLLPDLQPAEVFFLSLSVRKKYLTVDEREGLGLNRAEMFGRKIVREKSHIKFNQILRRLETNIEGFSAKNGKPYPQKALACYLNINPSNMLVANTEYQANIQKYSYEMTRALLNGKKCESIMKKFSKLDVELMNCVQRSRGQKKFIDIDFDVDKVTERFVLERFIEWLKTHGIKYHVVETHSGFHVLMERSTIKCNFHPIVNELHKLVKDEVVVNGNEMIPFPGTNQGGFVVRFLDM